MEPLFETSDTHSKVNLLEGEPQYLEFVLKGDPPHHHSMTIADFLEIFRIGNALWYGNFHKQLGICTAAFCQTIPNCGHIIDEFCPTQTEYETNAFKDYLERMQRLQMAKERNPIPLSAASDSAQPDRESPSIDSRSERIDNSKENAE